MFQFFYSIVIVSWTDMFQFVLQYCDTVSWTDMFQFFDSIVIVSWRDMFQFRYSIVVVAWTDMFQFFYSIVIQCLGHICFNSFILL